MPSAEAALSNDGIQVNGNGVLQDGAAEGSTTPTIPFDPSVLRSYLLALLPPLLDAAPDELETIFDERFDDLVARFAGENGGVVYVVKRREDVQGA